MPALSFSCKNKKEELIEKKCSQTIRPPRKNQIEEGDQLHIYWKQRVSPKKKDIHKIGEGTVIETHKIRMAGHFVEGSILKEESIKEIAEKDGFDNELEFKKWFDNRYDLEPFSRPRSFRIIRWNWEE